MIRAGPLTVKNREVRYWQSRSSLFTSTSTLVRSAITSNGPSSAGVPEANAITLPVTVSTNATSREVSCAASGLKHAPRIIEEDCSLSKSNHWPTPQIETTAMGHSHEGVSGDVSHHREAGQSRSSRPRAGRAALLVSAPVAGQLGPSSVLATQAPDGRASLPARFALHVRLVVTAWSKALVDMTLFPLRCPNWRALEQIASGSRRGLR